MHHRSRRPRFSESSLRRANTDDPVENNGDGNPPSDDVATAEPLPPDQPFGRIPDEITAPGVHQASPSGRRGMRDAGLDSSLRTLVDEDEADFRMGESAMGGRADGRAVVMQPETKY